MKIVMMRTSPRLGILFLLALATGLLWPSPKPAFADGVSAIAAGRAHTCAVTAAGGIKCWGFNQSGQLGNGVQSASDPNPVPLDVLGDPGTPPPVGSHVAIGFGHSCALLAATGGVKCWGNNLLGQLGDGQACGAVCTTAVDVQSLTGSVSAISSGGNHTCALMQTGEVKCWGLNHFGQLGAETAEVCGIISFSCSTTPVDVMGLESAAVAIAAGLEHSCAVTESGGVACWGKNHVGKLGDGTTVDSGSAVRVCQNYDNLSQQCTELLSDAIAVVAGAAHTCALVRAGSPALGNGVTCWGRNTFGQLGDGTPTDRTTPVGVLGLPSGVSAISATSNHTCIISLAGAVRCWGNNFVGQLGDGQGCGLFCTAPTEPAGLDTGVVAIAAGDGHTCAILSEGDATCWGQNEFGQLGDGRSCGQVCTSLVAVLGFGRPPDSDDDGCTDVRELSFNPTLGGLRDPKNPWDFFDPNRDGSVSLLDFLAILRHFGTTGDPSTFDPNAPEPAIDEYWPLADRGGQTPGGDPWDELPPNGSIGLADVLSLLRQFGHTCG